MILPIDSIYLWFAVLAVSISVLIKAADYFTDAAERIGIFFKIPPFIIGVTIVAIGTSLPEMISSLIAVSKGASEIVVGNVVGSNIANIFLVLGVVAIVARKVRITRELINVDLPLFIGSVFLLTVTIWDGSFGLGDAIISIAALTVYLAYTVASEKQADTDIKKEIKKETKEKQLKRKFSWKPYIHLVLGGSFIYLGAKFTIDSVLEISSYFNTGNEVIALTAVALGTSLPELIVSISAAKKGNVEMAIGNVLGSNIFNAVGVMGISGLFGVLVVPQTILFFSLPLMVFASLLLLFMTQDRLLTKWEGFFLLIFYVFFIGKLLGFI